MWAPVLLLGILTLTFLNPTSTVRASAIPLKENVSLEALALEEYGGHGSAHAPPPVCTPSGDLSTYFTATSSDYTYYVSTGDSVNSEDALAACESICAELTSVDDEPEFTFLNHLILLSGRTSDAFWTAGTNIDHESQSHGSHGSHGRRSGGGGPGSNHNEGHNGGGGDNDDDGYFWVTTGQRVKHFYPEHTRQPDNYHWHEHCINLQKYFSVGTSDIWILNDANCAGRIQYICRGPLAAVPPD